MQNLNKRLNVVQNKQLNWRSAIQSFDLQIQIEQWSNGYAFITYYTISFRSKCTLRRVNTYSVLTTVQFFIAKISNFLKKLVFFLTKQRPQATSKFGD